MKKKILITSFDMEIGGVERSLISMLRSFDYDKYDVDLLLYSKTGELLSELPDCGYTLLDEIPELTTFRKSIANTIKERHFLIAAARLMSRLQSDRRIKKTGIYESGFYSVQSIWEKCARILPKNKKYYDAAISYLWPHYYVGKKVNAGKKIGWIHFDYENVTADLKKDLKMWENFDYIVGVSNACCEQFKKIHPTLAPRVRTVENIISTDFIHAQANEFSVEDEMPDTGEIKLLTIGRFTSEKRFYLAIEWCKRLIDEGYKIKWYAIGYGVGEKYMHERIERLGIGKNFIMLGKKANPYPYIKQCDIYVQPSKSEGKAVSIIEAQILNKPVFITNFPTAKSQVIDGFDAIIAPLDPDEGYTKLKELLDKRELQQKLRENTEATNYNNAHEMKRLYEMIE